MSTINAVFPFLFSATGIALPFGVALSQKVGEKLYIIIGSFLLGGIILISSFIKSFILFVFIYGFLFGITVGCLYMVPINIGFKYFPNKKGMVSGIIASGFAFGSFIFSWIVYSIINPNN